MTQSSASYYLDQLSDLQAAHDLLEEELATEREKVAALQEELAVSLLERWKELATANRTLSEQVAALEADLRETTALLAAAREQRDAYRAALYGAANGKLAATATPALPGTLNNAPSAPRHDDPLQR